MSYPSRLSRPTALLLGSRHSLALVFGAFATLATIATIGAVFPATAFAQETKDAAPGREPVSPAVLALVQPVPELIREKKFTEALAKLKETEAIPGKTPYEIYVIDRMRGAAAAGAGDIPLAAKSYEAAIASGKLPPGDSVATVDMVARLYFTAKDYTQAAVWSTRLLKEGGETDERRQLSLRAKYFAEDYDGVRLDAAAVIQRTEQAGQKPTQEILELKAGAEQKMNDQAAYALTLEKLVATHPKAEYWKDLIYRVGTKPGFAPALYLNLVRLRYALGLFSKPEEYQELVERAMNAGFPVEAKQIIDQGYAKGILGAGSGTVATAQQKLRAKVTKDAADDIKDIKRAEAEALKSPDGTALIGVGFNYVVNGQADKGLPLMEQGIKKGGLKRPEEATLRLGMAYALAGQKDKAVATLKTVHGKDGSEDLARLWSLYAVQPIIPPATAKL
ncbi:MAG: hypothetical protein ABI905_16005 [Betaproteobacteria bacterium]